MTMALVVGATAIALGCSNSSPTNPAETNVSVLQSLAGSWRSDDAQTQGSCSQVTLTVLPATGLTTAKINIGATCGFRGFGTSGSGVPTNDTLVWSSDTLAT